MKNAVWLLLFLAAFGLAGVFWYSNRSDKPKEGEEIKAPTEQPFEGNPPPEGMPKGGPPGARTDTINPPPQHAPSNPSFPQPNNGGDQNFQPPPPSFDPPQYEPPPYEPPPYDQVPPPPPQKMDEFDNDPISPPPPMESPFSGGEGEYIPPPPPVEDE